MSNGKKVLAEGAQGSMLDIDFGSYPYVTSSNTISGGVCTGLGVAPGYIRQVKGIFKAYCTRVGGGPFPTELNDHTGELLREKGKEFGATTGRPRRTGWLDLVALKYAIMLNGVDELIMMKSDVLSGMDEIKVAEAYSLNGVSSSEVPFDVCNPDLKPEYTTYPGWTDDLSSMRAFSEIPENFKRYVESVEQKLSTQIHLISVGPDRIQTIWKDHVS